MDKLEPAARSALMGRIRGTDTAPEMAVRRAAHRLGYRFRLHRRSLPGRPDLVFPARRAVIFVHGCFWHRHEGCAKASTPKTRTDFWTGKFARNVERDREAQDRLEQAGWRVLVVWECGIRDQLRLESTLREFLGPAGKMPGHGTVPASTKE
ncbi:DNA mismatch endonuclease Vsr [Methylobacterium sp. 092160098-2]|uniref:very short patch repair endonuclease n=1 Tax=Methylobacterium sp. 092160098-2 TaxID=3025129 RepID=UPI002381C606|nr:DNA mismatch endonuclease Vsr [Methylobacterium sp. 092160098-2]MDE4914275.1 DNA mismatch endonuclease Vsr [Methylobacterium sp. 092160098-2]